MTITMASFSSSGSALLFALTLIPHLIAAQNRSPHGLAYAMPLAISPEAYAFFHPDAQHYNRGRKCNGSSSDSECSPIPAASSIQSNIARDSMGARSHRAGAGAWILIGLAFAALFTLSSFFFLVIKNRNLNKETSLMAKAEV
ncbi:unnamed protein product [Cuscuta europaea]|uniref:Uncharacterized protein n=1 Tax=Cuscuta europaea TaxID=41803 RepID=A0A9P0ZBY7_CUSEU|nr:unnamed protein product [Cuscuta europaea]